MRGLVITFHGGDWQRGHGLNQEATPSTKFWRKEFNRLFDHIPLGVEHVEFDASCIYPEQRGDTFEQPSRFLHFLQRSRSSLQALRVTWTFAYLVWYKLGPEIQGTITLPNLKYRQTSGRLLRVNSLDFPLVSHLSLTQLAILVLDPCVHDPLRMLTHLYLEDVDFRRRSDAVRLKNILKKCPSLRKLIILPPLDSINNTIAAHDPIPDLWMSVRHSVLSELEVHCFIFKEDEVRTMLGGNVIDEGDLFDRMPGIYRILLSCIPPFANKFVFPSLTTFRLKSLPFGGIGQEGGKAELIQNVRFALSVLESSGVEVLMEW